MNRKWIVMIILWTFITGLNMVMLPRRYAPSVETELVTQQPMPLLVRASGNLEAKDSNTVKIQFEGPVESKTFREGQQVVKGQLLAVIGREKIRLDYQNKHDALLNAQSDLDKARHDLRLQRALFKKEAVAYSTVEDAQRALVKSEQGLRNAQETFRQSLILWESNKVIAPITGTVVKDWVGDDKLVSAGKEIVTVADVSEFTVKSRVDELDIKQVHEGQAAKVRLQIYPDIVFAATVREVGSQSEGGALPEIPVVLLLQQTEGMLLRPKLTAEVQILTGWTPPTLSVPLTAVANSDGNPRVWFLDRWNRLRSTHVDLGKQNPERAEILSGVSAGDRVCTSAEPDFADGMKVRIGPPDPSAHRQSKTNVLLSQIKLSQKPDPKKDNRKFGIIGDLLKPAKKKS